MESNRLMFLIFFTIINKKDQSTIFCILFIRFESYHKIFNLKKVETETAKIEPVVKAEEATVTEVILPTEAAEEKQTEKQSEEIEEQVCSNDTNQEPEKVEKIKKEKKFSVKKSEFVFKKN